MNIDKLRVAANEILQNTVSKKNWLSYVIKNLKNRLLAIDNLTSLDLNIVSLYILY